MIDFIIKQIIDFICNLFKFENSLILKFITNTTNNNTNTNIFYGVNTGVINIGNNIKIKQTITDKKEIKEILDSKQIIISNNMKVKSID